MKQSEVLMLVAVGLLYMLAKQRDKQSWEGLAKPYGKPYAYGR